MLCSRFLSSALLFRIFQFFFYGIKIVNGGIFWVRIWSFCSSCGIISLFLSASVGELRPTPLHKSDLRENR